MFIVKAKKVFVCFILAVISLAAFPAEAGEVAYHTSGVVARYFDKARENEATLVAFLHQMPKGGDLHIHPAGAVSAETLMRTAIDKGLFFDRDSGSFVVDKPTGRYFSPAEMTATFWNTAEVLEALSLRNVRNSGESGHQRFFRSFFRFEPALADSLPIYREILAKAAKQGVSYLELMDVPKNDPEWLAEFERIRREVRSSVIEKDGFRELEVRFIYPLYRCVEPDSFTPQVEAAFRAAREMPQLVAGITILGPEDEWHSRTYFTEHMQAIDAAYKKCLDEHLRDPAANPPPPRLNLHGGELTLDFGTY